MPKNKENLPKSPPLFDSINDELDLHKNSIQVSAIILPSIMTDQYQSFVEAMECIPPELERNFSLMKNLDIRGSNVMKRIDDCVKRYGYANTHEERMQIRRDTNDLFDTLTSFAGDRLDISIQSYDAVDRLIIKLSNLIEQDSLVGVSMPKIEGEPVFCYCRSVSFDTMICCDDDSCKYEWFHYSCVNITEAPKGEWFCYDCAAKRIQSKTKKKKIKGRKR